MHCPWFLNPNRLQPPFLHCSLLVGTRAAGVTATRDADERLGVGDVDAVTVRATATSTGSTDNGSPPRRTAGGDFGLSAPPVAPVA
jgi:hypothetical protein